MSRIKPLAGNELPPSVGIAFERHLEEYPGVITNTKATLGHSLLAFEVYMQWYPLYDEVQKILGRRLAYLYAYTISNAAGCTLCTTFFSKIILDAGERPEHLSLTQQQKNVLDFGCSIVRHHGNIADHIYNEVAREYTSHDMITLIAFAGQMIAANVFNNVTETDIDEYLVAYLPPIKFC
jgi:hypothetical protein